MICCQYEDECVDSFKGQFHSKCINELKYISDIQDTSFFIYKECIQAHNKQKLI